MTDYNSEHQVIHELFHFLSSNQQLLFNENGVGYDKVGTIVSGYDREDNLADRLLEARGLNEGITELLATKVDKGSKPSSYYFQTHIADILISSQHNSLLKAYFSENENMYREFLEDFNKRQKYNPDDLFKNKIISTPKNESNIEEKVALVEYKEKSFIKKLFEKIKHLFKID